jgi:hypothetical protein
VVPQWEVLAAGRVGWGGGLKAVGVSEESRGGGGEEQSRASPFMAPGASRGRATHTHGTGPTSTFFYSLFFMAGVWLLPAPRFFWGPAFGCAASSFFFIAGVWMRYVLWTFFLGGGPELGKKHKLGRYLRPRILRINGH